MYLTATLKLRTNNHDRARLRRAIGRWHHAYALAMAAAECRQKDLLGCLTQWSSKDGRVTRLVVDGKALHAIVLQLVPASTGLHSSTRMSMIVSVEEVLKSWLGLYAAWVNGGRKSPKPGFPTTPPGTATAAKEAWAEALEASAQVVSRTEEDAWRAQVTRASKGRTLPLAFGAATSGVTGQAHMGLLRRDDGRVFALLTLFGAGDGLGEPVRRARNRGDRGEVRNLRADEWEAFAPTDRAKASIMCPVEMGARTRRMFFDNGLHRQPGRPRPVPKSGDLVERDGEFYLHIAFDMGEVPQHPQEAKVLAIRRGVSTLAAGVLVDERGNVLERRTFSDGGLARTITAIAENRAKRQAKGKLTTGDRRAAAITEETLHLVAHQIVRWAATEKPARIVLLADPQSRRPQRFLAWKHWDELHRVLARCCEAAGVVSPEERKIYGSWSICTSCGAVPDATAPRAEPCSGCGAERDPEWHLVTLLALDTLQPVGTGRMPLGKFIQGLRTAG